MTDLVIVADDLTGAGDAAVAFAATTTVAVITDPAAPWPEAEVLAIDTDTRYTDEPTATSRVTTAITQAHESRTAEPGVREPGVREPGVRESGAGGPGARGPWAGGAGVRVYKKIDSLLRGNVATEVRAAARAIGGADGPVLAVVAPAFPATGRTVRGGVLYVHGAPLLPPGAHRTGDLATLLGDAGLRVRTVRECTPEVLEKARADGIDAVVCDAETDADLAAVAHAVSTVPFPVLPVGSAGLAAHLTPPPPAAGSPAEDRALTPPSEGSAADASSAAPGAEGHVLVVVGSYAREARAQRDALVAAGFVPVLCDEGRDVSEAGAALRATLATADVVLSPDPAAPVDRRRSAAVAARLAALTVAAVPGAGLLVATGGETARAVLNRLDVRELWPTVQPEPGVVVSRVPGLRPRMVTKAGAFGDAQVLVRVIRTLSGGPRARRHPQADDASGYPRADDAPGVAGRGLTCRTGAEGGK